MKKRVHSFVSTLEGSYRVQHDLEKALERFAECFANEEMEGYEWHSASLGIAEYHVDKSGTACFISRLSSFFDRHCRSGNLP